MLTPRHCSDIVLLENPRHIHANAPKTATYTSKELCGLAAMGSLLLDVLAKGVWDRSSYLTMNDIYG